MITTRCRLYPWILFGLVWLAGIGVLIGSPPTLSVEADSSPPRPNVVVILCDDMGYGDLGCFGNPIIKTPHLDRLAGEGVKLTQCYAGSPVCSPSRAALMTGRNPNRYGIHDWIPPNSGIFLPRNELTIASLLKSAGYYTALVGKWHLSSRLDGSEPTPGDHGFEHWMATQNNAVPSHENPVNFIRNGRKVGPLQGNSSTLIVDEAVRVLDSVKERNFALFVCFHAPHEPVATPDAFTRLYSGERDPTKRTYFGSVSLIDHEVGRLLGALERTGLREKTLVFFTSDNGPEALKRYPGAEHSHGSAGSLRGRKLQLYEGGIRVPGILRWPGRFKAGAQCDKPLMFTDVLPTLCSLAGVSPPVDRPLDGINVMPLLEDESYQRVGSLYWQYDKATSKPWTVALRRGPWKLLADQYVTRFALFNLDDDPHELRNLAERDPDRVRELGLSLFRLHKEVNSR